MLNSLDFLDHLIKADSKEAISRWLNWLIDERRLSKNTKIAYLHDLEVFLSFLSKHFGHEIQLTDLENVYLSEILSNPNLIPLYEKKLYKLHNQLVKDGIEVISEENEFVHVSGHPNRDDLREMYDWVKPQCAIPVHGEHRHMIEHINFANEMKVPHPVQVENGDIVKLFPVNKPEVYDKAPSGRLYLDGNISVEEDSQSIKDRKNLSSNGYLEVTILITPKGNIHNSPIASFRGLPIYKKEEFIYGLEDEIEKTLDVLASLVKKLREMSYTAGVH